MYSKDIIVFPTIQCWKSKIDGNGGISSPTCHSLTDCWKEMRNARQVISNVRFTNPNSSVQALRTRMENGLAAKVSWLTCVKTQDRLVITTHSADKFYSWAKPRFSTNKSNILLQGVPTPRSSQSCYKGYRAAMWSSSGTCTETATPATTVSKRRRKSENHPRAPDGNPRARGAGHPYPSPIFT